MRRRTVLILLLALASGGLAGWAALRLIAEQQIPIATPAQAAGPKVVVAARDLALGSLVGQEDVKVIDWPSGSIPLGYAQSVPDVVGRGVLTPVLMNEPLLDTKLADRSGGGGLPIVIEEGMRAVSVRVDGLAQVAGFAIQGTRVDIVLVTMPPGGGEVVAKTVLQNMPVIAAGQATQPDPEGNPVVVDILTFHVTPEDAEKLILASSSGRIQMALRNKLDVKEVRTPGANLSRVFSGAPTGRTTTSRPATRSTPSPQPQPEAQSRQLEIITGSQRSVIRFGNRGGG